MGIRAVRKLGIGLVMALALAPTTALYAQEDPIEESDASLMAQMTANTLDKKCACPESESGLEAFSRCLAKQQAAALKSAKDWLKYTRIARGEFRTALGEFVDAVEENCSMSFEDPDEGDGGGGDDPGEEF